MRYKFLTYKQKKDQCFEEFMTQSKKSSSDCEFGELKNCLIVDIVVVGVINNFLRVRMNREPNLTVEKETPLGQFAEQMKK